MDHLVAATAPIEEPPAETNESHPLDKMFARGSAWAMVNYAVGSAVRLGSNLILWRLLYPEAFGLMAIVNVFIQGLAMFSDIGIGQSVVHNPRGEDPKFLDTVWTLQIIRGLGINAFACLAAYPLARFYGRPELTGLVIVVAIGGAIAAFNSTKFFTASRKLAIARITVVDISGQIGGLAAMTIWGYLTHSVWALAVGSLVSPLIRLYLSFAILPGHNDRLGWDRDTIRTVSHFGRWIFISTILTFLASHSDRLIFGRLVSMQRLGVYSIAMVWVTFPIYIIAHLVTVVMFPVFCRLAEQDGSMKKAFTRLRMPLSFACAWIFSCLGAGGPCLVRLLYDQRADEGGQVIQLLAVGSWFACLESMNESAILAHGKPKQLAFGQLAKVITMALLLPAAGWAFGFFAMVFALSLSEAARYAVSVRACIRLGLSPVRQDALFSAGTALMVGVGLLVREGYGRMHIHFATVRVDAFFEGLAVFLVLSAIWLGLYGEYRRRNRGAEA
jgi:O-antigen/teichoic acid export membrane protein